MVSVSSLNIKHCVHLVFDSCNSNGFFLHSKGFNPSLRRNQCPNTPLLVCSGGRDVAHCSISLLNLFEIHEISYFLHKFLVKLSKNLPIYLHRKFPLQNACSISHSFFLWPVDILFSEAVCYQKTDCHFFFFKKHDILWHNEEVIVNNTLLKFEYAVRSLKEEKNNPKCELCIDLGGYNQTKTFSSNNSKYLTTSHFPVQTDR